MKRREVIGGIFADVTKYTLTVGVIGSLIKGDISFQVSLIFGLIVALFGALAYFVTPEDQREG